MEDLATSTSRPETAYGWHALPVEAVVQGLESHLDFGLSRAEAARRLQEHGPNLLPEARATSATRQLLHQFQSLLIYVLLAAAVISLLLGDLLEFVSIVVIAVLNASLGFVQEFRAERALSALRALSAPGATVRREGAPERIHAREIVPGDVLLIESGDVIAADARVFEATSLSASEAVLTGESVPVDKSPQEVSLDAELADRSSMVYQSTQIARGRGRAVVVGTGERTEIGRIAALVSGRAREETPLQRELSQVGRYLVAAAAFLCFVVFIAGVLRDVKTSEMFLIAASLAVAAIPEGLPAAATIVLALGVQRMAKRQALVRRLSSVETLGSVTTVFTDKTGTLTLNRMSVQDTWTATSEAELLRIATLCNDASLGNEQVKQTGDPMEIALLSFARDRGLDVGSEARRWRRELELPFDAARARMTVVVHDEEARRMALMKGAPEVVIERSTIARQGASPIAARDVLRRSADMAARGLRVLAFAHRHLTDQTAETELEQDLEMVGLVGLADPLREEAGEAIATAEAAGIRIVMLTGDQPATAVSIGRQLGLEGAPITGRDVEALGLDELREAMAASQVFARVTSDHKLRIIEAARDDGQIVAMTGDGVNDAPALRAADIGVAMGRGGTDVAREASDMVLTDDNFSSIVAAIEEGRSIHANIRRFIHFLLSCNAAEVTLIFVVLLAYGEPALTPLQILFVNLLTDGMPALALGVEPASEGIMRRGPRPRGSGLVSARSLVPIAGVGGLIALTSLVAFVVGSALEDSDLAQRLAFATLVGSQLSASLVFRSETEVAVRLKPNFWLIGALAASLAALLGAFYLPPLQDAFDTAPLSWDQWFLVAALSLLPLLAGEGIKLTGLLRRLGLTPPELVVPR